MIIPSLDPSVLTALGRELGPEKSTTEPIHQNLAVQWGADLINGLNPDTRSSLLAKYTLPSNLSAAKPPQLNIELLSVLPEASIKRDTRLEQVQSQMGLGLAALGKAQTILLNTGSTGQNDSYLVMLEAINDAARFLADIHHEQSVARQHLISISLDKSVKDLLPETKLDGWLFGGNLLDRVKNAKALVKSSLELKAKKKTAVQAPARLAPTTGVTKNFKRPFKVRKTLEGDKSTKPYHRKPQTSTSSRVAGSYQKYEQQYNRTNIRRHR